MAGLGSIGLNTARAQGRKRSLGIGMIEPVPLMLLPGGLFSLPSIS